MNDRVVEMCTKCFETKNNCLCGNSVFVEVDKNIYPSVKELNKKNYTTIACCEGHPSNSLLQTYVLFDKKYAFETLPNRANLRDKGRLIEFITYRNKSLKCKERNKESDLENLYEWTKKLKKNVDR